MEDLIILPILVVALAVNIGFSLQAIVSGIIIGNLAGVIFIFPMGASIYGIYNTISKKREIHCY